jgi:glycosyltransferase involved in cell wall biosynthesis
MNAHPKVSVCIPTYNYAHYLPEAIESVLNQRYGNYELIIIDDCSNDNSSAIIEQYSRLDRRIVYHINDSNRGMVNNWNLCLQSARGDYIKFLFGDDVMSSEDALEKMVAVFDSHEDIALAASARNVINEQSHFVKVLTEYKEKICYKGHKIIQDCLLEQKNKIGEPSAVMFSRQHAYRGFDERYRQIVDLEMWFHILEKGNFAYLEEPLCSFRMHTDQQTRINMERVDLDRPESLWLINDYANKPYIHFSAVTRKYMKYGPVYSFWKLYKQGKISRQTALQNIKKHYTLKQFYLYYPFFRFFKFGRRIAEKIRTGR